MPTYHAPQNPPVPPSSLTFDLLQNPVKPIHVSLQNSNFPDHPCAYLHRDFPICAKTHDPGVINTNPLAALRASSKRAPITEDLGSHPGSATDSLCVLMSRAFT